MQLGRIGDDTFEGTWAPELGEGTYELIASDESLGLESPPITVEVDATPPRFLIEVAGSSGPATERRRDEKVEVRVKSEDSDVDPDRVRLVVTGVPTGGDAGVGFGLDSCEGSPPGGYCGRSEIDLSKPRLEAFAGTFMIQVEGTDETGNSGTVGKELPVTRLRWRLDMGTPLSGPPALDTRGALYVDLRGKVVKMNPDFALVKDAEVFVLGGQQGLAVGPVSGGGPELLYLLDSSFEKPPARLRALDRTHLQGVGDCLVGDASFQSGESLVLGTGPAVGGGATEVALAAFSNHLGQIQYVALRKGAGTAPVCLSGSSNLSSPLRLFANGSRFYADSNGHLEEVLVSESGLVARKLSPPCTPTEVDVMAGPLLIGVEPAWSYAYDTRDDRCSAFQAGGKKFAEVDSDVRVDAQGRLLFAKKRWGEAGFAVSRISRETSEVTEFLSPRREAPELVLGADGRIHGVTRADSRLQVWTSGLEAAWDRAAPSPSRAGAGSTLDCIRDAQRRPIPGGMGVWYVAEGSRLSAILVDSPGIDAEALWPVSRHDPQGTGNAATDLHPFQCASSTQARSEAPCVKEDGCQR